MDAFYAAVAMRDEPHLASVPMAVGSMGMLSTSNYKARQFGVRAGMPGFIGKKLCPHLVLVPLDFPKYRAVPISRFAAKNKLKTSKFFRLPRSSAGSSVSTTPTSPRCPSTRPTST